MISLFISPLFLLLTFSTFYVRLRPSHLFHTKKLSFLSTAHCLSLSLIYLPSHALHRCPFTACSNTARASRRLRNRHPGLTFSSIFIASRRSRRSIDLCSFEFAAGNDSQSRNYRVKDGGTHRVEGKRNSMQISRCARCVTAW